MRYLALFLAISGLAAPALAEDWALRAGDAPLDRAAAVELTTDSILTFYDDGQSRYGPDGQYSYTYSAANGGGAVLGRYRVAEDGRVCVDYPHGIGRCDLYVMAGGRLVLITRDGERYPVRP
jgi:hypothetical protein